MQLTFSCLHDVKVAFVKTCFQLHMAPARVLFAVSSTHGLQFGIGTVPSLIALQKEKTRSVKCGVNVSLSPSLKFLSLSFFLSTPPPLPS